jgi:two-component sensor histidine kinase
LPAHEHELVPQYLYSHGLHLIEELNHRVLNDYAEAIAELRLASALELGPTGLALDAAADRLLRKAQVHRALRAPSSPEAIELSAYLEEICAALCDARLTDLGVSLALVMDNVRLDADRCWLIGLILTELINNAARHGLRRGPRHIGVRLASDGRWMLCAVTNPAPAEPANAKGRGHRVIAALSSELGGTVNWKFCDDQCLACLSVPIVRPLQSRTVWQSDRL